MMEIFHERLISFWIRHKMKNLSPQNDKQNIFVDSFFRYELSSKWHRWSQMIFILFPLPILFSFCIESII